MQVLTANPAILDSSRSFASLSAAAPSCAAGAPESAILDTATNRDARATATNVADKKSALADAVGGKVKIEKNGTIEGALRSQGYSLGEIYTKDAQGKTLADRVGAANGLSDPRKLQVGAELSIPARKKAEAPAQGGARPAEGGAKTEGGATPAPSGGKSEAGGTPIQGGGKGVSLFAQERGEGYTRATENNDSDGSVTHSLSENGRHQYTDVSLRSGGSGFDVATRVRSTGTIAGGLAPTAEGVGLDQVAHNDNRSAITGTSIRSQNGTTIVGLEDVDGAVNSRVTVDQNGLAMVNAGDKGQGKVRTEIGLGPRSWTEEIGKKMDGWAPDLFGQQTTSGDVRMDGVRSVRGVSRDDGSAHLVITGGDGKTREFAQSQRGFFQSIGKSLGDVAQDFRTAYNAEMSSGN